MKKALELQVRRTGYDNIDTLNTSDTLAALYISQSCSERRFSKHALHAFTYGDGSS